MKTTRIEKLLKFLTEEKSIDLESINVAKTGSIYIYNEDGELIKISNHQICESFFNKKKLLI